MNINLNEFILFLSLLYSLIKIVLTQENIQRNLDSETSSSDCSSYNDCFNCTIIPSCRWNSSKDECIPYEEYNTGFSISQINHHASNNINFLNNYFNFIRKVCFSKTTPMITNNQSKIYNSKSIAYCGEHYIMATEENLENDFKIELKNINGLYGTPNLLCEYIFFSGVNSFYINIKIDQNEAENFYLLYSEDSINIIQNIKSSTTLNIQLKPSKTNTFIFYGLKSFSSSPFSITYKSTFFSNSKNVTGYVMLALIIVVIAIIIFAIIYIRKNSSLFKKKEKKIKKEKDKSKAEENSLIKKRSAETNATGLSIIRNFRPETPVELLEKEKERFYYEKCAFDGQFFNKNDDFFEAKCGHFYHQKCYNKLLEESKDKKEIKCVICNKNI